jgi:diadenosine tetraphosphate (Ap4A) HIT family hydrolase
MGYSSKVGKDAHYKEHAMEVADEYKPNLIKKYHFWDLFLNPKQRYLGRSYIWWRGKSPTDGENMRYDALPAEALIETQQVWRDVVRYCRMLGYTTEPYGEHFKLNTSYLANEKMHNGHMHFHFVPRTSTNFYCEPVGVETMDEEFKKMYISSSDDRILGEPVMQTLRRLGGLYAIG